MATIDTTEEENKKNLAAKKAFEVKKAEIEASVQAQEQEIRSAGAEPRDPFAVSEAEAATGVTRRQKEKEFGALPPEQTVSGRAALAAEQGLTTGELRNVQTRTPQFRAGDAQAQADAQIVQTGFGAPPIISGAAIGSQLAGFGERLGEVSERLSETTANFQISQAQNQKSLDQFLQNLGQANQAQAQSFQELVASNQQDLGAEVIPEFTPEDQEQLSNLLQQEGVGIDTTAQQSEIIRARIQSARQDAATAPIAPQAGVSVTERSPIVLASASFGTVRTRKQDGTNDITFANGNKANVGSTLTINDVLSSPELAASSSMSLLNSELAVGLSILDEAFKRTTQMLESTEKHFQQKSDQANALFDKFRTENISIIRSRKLRAADEKNRADAKLARSQARSTEDILKARTEREAYLKQKLSMMGALDGGSGLSFLGKEMSKFDTRLDRSNENFTELQIELDTQYSRIMDGYTEDVIKINQNSEVQQFNTLQTLNDQTFELRNRKQQSLSDLRIDQSKLNANYFKEARAIEERARKETLDMVDKWDKKVQENQSAAKAKVDGAWEKVKFFYGQMKDGNIPILTEAQTQELRGLERLAGVSTSLVTAFRGADQVFGQMATSDFNAGGWTITAGTSGNRPDRNNSPYNIKAGGIADNLASKDDQGDPRVDDQNHLIFPDQQAGYEAGAMDVSQKLKGETTNPAIVAAIEQKGLDNITIRDIGRGFAEDPAWAKGVVSVMNRDFGTNVNVNTKISEMDQSAFINAIPTQEGWTGSAAVVRRKSPIEKNKDAIMAQIQNGFMTPKDISGARELAGKQGWIDDFTKAVSDPKNKAITDTTAAKFQIPLGTVKGKANQIVKSRERAGFGNSTYQSIGTKEYASINTWLQMQDDLIAMKALKEGSSFISTLSEDEQAKLRLEFDIDESFGGINTGGGVGIQQGFAEFFGIADNQKLDLETLSGKYTVAFMKQASGVAISEPEANRLQKLIPQIKQSDDRFTATSDDAIRELEKTLKAAAARFGFNSIDAMRNANFKVRSGDMAAFGDGLQIGSIPTPPAGQITIMRNGQIGFIPEAEFNQSTDQRL